MIDVPHNYLSFRCDSLMLVIDDSFYAGLTILCADNGKFSLHHDNMPV